ncbi:CoA transferase [Bradyrhizobium prioriisuperbiae]|uniref:CaiB/BaiF CoA transferase family protein n=1 Tax=Bradyrhizobium prioriisuperbiae TaxID=2854389 RepID=UPI0028EB6858|nr:CoA transferase [Bradyrhizobium prioritasuperba]
MTSTQSTGALEGIRVIDLTQMLAGPYCTMMLADQGAEVIKVEPMEGDATRAGGPFRADDTLQLYGGYFASVNRNKKSIALDLKSPEGRAILIRLCNSADAVIENFRAGVMDRLGLSYEMLRKENPKLVYASIRGFGDPRTGRSPYTDWPAYDPVAQAMGGIMGITGPDADTPMKVGPGVGDTVPAAMAAFGVVCAILRAGRTGEGQYVDVSMVDVMLSICERIVHQRAFQGVNPHPEGNRHPLLAPFGMLKASDGWVTIAAHTDEFWKTLCGLIGRKDLVDDPRMATRQARVANKDAVYDAVGAFVGRHTKQQLKDLLGGKIPFGPVYHIDEIAGDPHFAVREMIVEVEQPGCATPVTIAGVPIRMTETPGAVRRRAPLLGEDSDEVLRAIGFAPGEIAGLRQAEVMK